jgi:transcriptional regulator with XRE-family HTH domain
MRGLHQGERLLLLANRSGLKRPEIAKQLNIHPGHLSKLFKSEILTLKIKRSSADLFGVDESYFEVPDVSGIDFVAESEMSYKPKEIDQMTAAEILMYLQAKDERHYEERARLLAIIENLTKK